MVSPEQNRQKVFISYSHHDEEWLERLRVHLRPLERDYDIEVWDDTKIVPGSHWREEIKRAVELAKVAVLLVSADFLASKFIAEDELPPLLKAAENEGATILSVILSPCRFIKTESLSRFQAINHPSTPLIKMARGDQEEMFVRLSEEIERYIKLPTILKSTRLPADSGDVSVTPREEIPIRKIETTHEEDLPLGSVEPPQLKAVLEPNITTKLSVVANSSIDLAISFDGYQIYVYRRGHGIVISEPSIIAINASTNTVEALGSNAEQFFYGVSNIAIYNPINDGKVSDRALAGKILQYFINKSCGADRNARVRSRIVIAIPPSLTHAERSALVDAAYNAKAIEVYIVERILCAAMGISETTRRPRGHMIVYVGKNSIEVIAISQDGRASFQPEGVLIRNLRNEITQYIKRKYNLLIGEQVAEEVKLKLGSAFPLNEPLSLEIRGLNSIEGIPKTVTITDEEVREALGDAIYEIVKAVRGALERTPQQVAADIIGGGIILTGAEANLKRLDKRLAIETGLPVSIANTPEASVALGAGKMLSDIRLPIEKREYKPLWHKGIKLLDSLITPLARRLSADLAIDLGTNNTLIFARGRGIIVSEPSVIVVNRVTKLAAAVGKDAKEMMGRTPGNFALLRPLKNGIVINSTAARSMLRYFIRRAHNGKVWVRPRVIITIPSGLTKIERQDFLGVAYQAKAAEVYLVERMMAAAIGTGLPITEPHGNMLVNIGGGTTDIAVISLSGIVYSRVIRVAGNTMDMDVTQYIKRRWNLLIGERTAEAIKIQMGSAFPLNEPLSMDVRGRNLIEGIPKTITITDEEVREALADSVATIVNAVRVALERTPPELSADIVERGIVLTGGSALLKNLDLRLSIETGLPVSIAEDPLSSVVLGAGKMLSDFDLLKRVRLDDEFSE